MSSKTGICLVLHFISIGLITFQAEMAISGTLKNETDRAALLAFKRGITEDPLGVMISWNNSLHFCQWRGVTCSRRHQRVTTLDLNSSRLAGSLSSYIGNLSFIRRINLRDNKFHGDIPQEVGHLSRLLFFNLMNNTFQGEIPVNLSHCSHLLGLGLGFNQLTGSIPMELGSLSKLDTLILHSNNLTGRIPSSLGNLTSLTILSVAMNNLEGSIPDTFGQMLNLQVFAIAVNKLSGMIPPLVYNLSGITEFSTAHNQLQGSLPPDIGLTLPNLQEFGIGGNLFSGPIPVSLSNASGISRLDLSLNKFSGAVPDSLGQLQNLWWLNLGNNYLGSGGYDDDLRFITSLANRSNLQQLGLNDNLFGGSLPNSLTNLSTQLTYLLLGRNQISGSIPKGIESLTSLTQLAMEQNSFTGIIPTSIGMLSRLQVLYLNGNNLSGSIPSSLGNLTQLFDLMLANNNLEGSIPSSLGNCQKLQVLRLFNNGLDGIIPGQAIGHLSLLFHLNLSHNSLNGSIPIEIGNLQNLATLSISDNKLSGQVPSALSNCLTLEALYLQGNTLEGTIPSSWRSLRAIKYLDLSHNNLSGQIPEYLENFSLWNLNLSFNDLEGEVPIGGFFRNLTKFSILGNQKLCGGIPELQLPSCPVDESKKQGISLAVKIIIAASGTCLTLTVLFSAFFWRRKSMRQTSASFSEGRFLRVSYNELFKATNGFGPENLIGAGSFGCVYKGVLEQDEKPIAVKVLNLQERGAAKSFLVECETLRRVRHRNLIKILSTCSSLDFKGNDFKALVFEFMPNGSLEGWLHPIIDGLQQPRVLNLRQRLDIAIDVASALDYLHHHSHIPIVHSDLKPSNVLLDDDMIAHVADFGLAKFLNRSTYDFSDNQMSSIAIKGSIGYISPEYGMGSEVSRQGDVYSYGILLLEIITGKRPTDEMFKDGLSLRNFAEKALPHQVMQIADPQLFPDGVSEVVNNIDNQGDIKGRMQECLTSLVKIGVACSADSPGERMDIKDVFMEMNVTKEVFLGVGIHRRR